MRKTWTIAVLVLVVAMAVLPGSPARSIQAASLSSIRSGNWSDPTTWNTGRIPQSTDLVKISSGTTVTYDVLSDQVLGDVLIEGILSFSRTTNTRLKTSGNILVMMGGFLDMGTKEDFLPKSVKAEIIFALSQAQANAYVGDPGFASTDKGLWVMEGGRWEVHGAPLLRPWSKLVADAPPGGSFLIVEHDLSDWSVGGYVLISQSSNPLQSSPEAPVWENEVRRITALEKLPNSKTKLTLNQPLAYLHHGSPDPDAMRGEVGLLTRNILFTTDIADLDEQTLESKITDRFSGTGSDRFFAHTIYLPGAQGNLQYAEFKYMGHAQALGRYPLHFHLMGQSSKGMTIRGNSVWYSGHRAFVLHETIGMLIEDNLAFNTVNSPYFVEVSFPAGREPKPFNQPAEAILAAPQDNVFFHNLGVEAMGGSPRTDASIFWFDQYLYQIVMGNVAVGSNLNAFDSNVAGFQLDEITNIEVAGKPPAMLFRKNEAHSNGTEGLRTWQGNAISHDFVEFFLWRNGNTGWNWNSYVPTYRIFQSKFYENGLTGIVTQGIRINIQDSQFLSGGSDWTQVWKGAEGSANHQKAGFFVSHYTAVPDPSTSSHFIRNTFKNTAPNYVGDFSRTHQGCENPADELVMGEGKSACPGDFFDLMANSHTDKPFDAGWHENANSYFRVTDYQGAGYPKDFYLHRKDQTLGSATLGEVSRLIINESTVYDAKSDAQLTPISQRLPVPNLAGWENSLLSYPPAVSLGVSVAGTQATLRADATDDKGVSGVEFFMDEELIGSDKDAPYEASVELKKHGRKYAYLYARAFDGEMDNAASAPCVDGEDSGDCPIQDYPFLWNRAYSKVIELGPEVLLAGKPLLPPPIPPTTHGKGANRPPVVSDGQDQTIPLPALASPDGTVSDVACLSLQGH